MKLKDVVELIFNDSYYVKEFMELAVYEYRDEQKGWEVLNNDIYYLARRYFGSNKVQADKLYELLKMCIPQCEFDKSGNLEHTPDYLEIPENKYFKIDTSIMDEAIRYYKDLSNDIMYLDTNYGFKFLYNNDITSIDKLLGILCDLLDYAVNDVPNFRGIDFYEDLARKTSSKGNIDTPLFINSESEWEYDISSISEYHLEDIVPLSEFKGGIDFKFFTDKNSIGIVVFMYPKFGDKIKNLYKHLLEK